MGIRCEPKTVEVLASMGMIVLGIGIIFVTAVSHANSSSIEGNQAMQAALMWAVPLMLGSCVVIDLRYWLGKKP